MPSQHLGQSAVASVPITSHQNSPPVFAQECHAASPSASTTFSAVRRTHAEADAEPPACFVCMDAAADAVLIECGHGGLCVGALSTLHSAHIFVSSSLIWLDRELAAFVASSTILQAYLRLSPRGFAGAPLPTSDAGIRQYQNIRSFQFMHRACTRPVPRHRPVCPNGQPALNLYVRANAQERIGSAPALVNA
jgi:hypothetical protein